MGFCLFFVCFCGVFFNIHYTIKKAIRMSSVILNNMIREMGAAKLPVEKIALTFTSATVTMRGAQLI